MAINHNELKKALKILAENPQKIAEEKAKYDSRMAEIAVEEKTGNFSPNYIKSKREQALADRDRICHVLAKAMRPALETVKANSDFESEPISLDNAKLNSALNMLSIMGKGMQYTDQINLVSQFRGDPASLRVLEAAFAKDGKEWASRYAKDLQKTISSQAIAEMETVLAFHDYAEEQGRFDFPIERAHWTKGQFAEFAGRMGYDLGAVADPYILALDETMRGLQEMEMSINVKDEESAKQKAEISAKRYGVALAKAEMQKAKNSGEDFSAVFNRVMARIEKGEDPAKPATPAQQNSGESIDAFVADMY